MQHEAAKIVKKTKKLFGSVSEVTSVYMDLFFSFADTTLPIFLHTVFYIRDYPPIYLTIYICDIQNYRHFCPN